MASKGYFCARGSIMGVHQMDELPRTAGILAHQHRYFPITKKAYDIPAVKQHQAKYPQFTTAVSQLRDSPITRATQGALLGVFTQAREIVEDAIEQVLAGRATSLEALKKAAQQIDAAIGRYNMTVGR